MKTMLDRANPLFPADYQFRDIYLLAAAAEEDEHTVDGAVTGLQAGSTALKRPVWPGLSLPAA